MEEASYIEEQSRSHSKSQSRSKWKDSNSKLNSLSNDNGNMNHNQDLDNEHCHSSDLSDVDQAQYSQGETYHQNTIIQQFGDTEENLGGKQLSSAHGIMID